MKRKILLTMVVLLTLMVSLIAQKNSKKETSFNLLIIDSSGYKSPWLKTIGDLNKDGKTDIIVGGYDAGGLNWYRNPDWKKFGITEGKGFSTDGEVGDMNKDGFMDLICVKSGIVWYQNPGNPESGKWIEHPVSKITSHDIEVTDLDADGNLDIVGRNQQEWGKNGDVIHLYRNDGNDAWSYSTKSCPKGEGLLVTDIDNDGKPDILVNRTWYKNDGVVSGKWTEYTYSNDYTQQNTYIEVADLNGDGRKDIILTPSELVKDTFRISWFEAPALRTSIWKENNIEDNVISDFHFCGCADFDRDGDIDLLVAEMTQGPDPDEIKLFLNEGNGKKWKSIVIDTNGSHSMRIFDANGDGYMDFFGANWRANGKDESVKLWINSGRKQ